MEVLWGGKSQELGELDQFLWSGQRVELFWGSLPLFQISLMTSSSSSFVYMWNFIPGSTVASWKRRSKGLNVAEESREQLFPQICQSSRIIPAWNTLHGSPK